MSQPGSPTPQMREIPLSLVEEEKPDLVLDAAPDGEKRTSKADSLRRFFKFSNHRMGIPNRLTVDTIEPEMETGNQDKGDNPENVGATSSPKDKDKDAGKPTEKVRRFHLRLGSTQKIDTAEPVVAATIDNTASTSAGTTGGPGPNKPTLKGSISNYWNAVFKRSSSASRANMSAANSADLAKKTTDIDSEDEETELREELHTLALSYDDAEEKH